MTGIPVSVAANLIANNLAAMGVDTTSITPGWLASILGDAPRCRDCARPIWAASSIRAGRGPRCAAKLAGRGGP
jgi:hypothetical protein